MGPGVDSTQEDGGTPGHFDFQRLVGNAFAGEGIWARKGEN